MKKKVPGVLLGLGIAVLVSALAFWNPLQVIQWKITDLFFRGRPASDEITIIAIDDKSLSPEAGLGSFKTWPRSYYAELLRTINKHKPAVVAFDLDFRQGSKGIGNVTLKQLLNQYEKNNGSINLYEILKAFDSSSHPDDIDFQNVLNETKSVVLFSFLPNSLESNQNGEVFNPIFSVTENLSVGYGNLVLDRDRILRHFTPRKGTYKSFAVAIAEAFSKKTVDKTFDFQIPINYAAPAFSYRMIPFVDVLRSNYKPADISNKIILIGATSRIIQDLHSTPTSRLFMPGVEIHANIIQQLLEGKFLYEQPQWSIFFAIALFAIIGSLLFLKLRIIYGLLLFAFVLIVYPAAAFSLYQKGLVLNVVYPEITWVFTVIGALLYRNHTEFREKREIKLAFSRYVSPVVVEELSSDPTMLKLGGKREKISVMFSDIVGFTTLAEQMSPEDTVALLNDYLTAMTEVIFTYHGTLDKYQGDAIMALFGAPLADALYAQNACSSALAMRRALVSLHEKWNSIANLPFKDNLIQLDFRVGIATGSVVIGNVGSEKRFDYTAIGDIVNLGSRLESLNKKYGTHIMVNKETFVKVTENGSPFVFRKLDTVRVKGKTHATEIFELVATSETITEEMKAMLDYFENGRILYTQRNFKDALPYFESALAKFPEDGPTKIYISRCEYFLKHPPDTDWDAVVELEEK